MDGKRPSIGAIAQAAKAFKKPKKQVGRPAGKRKTTKREDRQIMTAFKKVPTRCSRRSLSAHFCLSTTAPEPKINF